MKTDRGSSTSAREVTSPRRSGWVFWLGGLLLVLAAGVLLSLRSGEIMGFINRPVSSVRIETPLQRVSETQVRPVLALHLEEGFFGFSAAALKSELEQHPWIEQAVVRRVWPDAVAISIYEEVPIARWGDDQLLNQSGSLFTPASIDENLALPLLRGPEGAQRQMMEQYQLFSQMLMPAGLRIRELSVNDRGSWAVTVTGDLLVNIGRTQIMERMNRFITFYDKLIEKEVENVSAIDLRYRNGVSVRRKEHLESGVAAR